MRYSYGCYISEYRSLDNLMDDFDSIVESFFNENNNFSALLEAEGDNKQSLEEVIKEKFAKLVDFVKNTLIPKIKDIFAVMKGKLISVKDAVNNIIKSGRLTLNKDIKITRANVAAKCITDCSNAINNYVKTDDPTRIDEIKQVYDKMETEFNDDKNKYTAKAGEKINPIELTNINKNIEKVAQDKESVEGNIPTIVTSISRAQNKVQMGSDDAKKIYDSATFGVKMARDSVKYMSKYIADANTVVRSLEEYKANKQQAQQQQNANK